MKTLEVKNREDWRTWLDTNHDQVSEVWLIFYKKASGQSSITYSEALDEALCYGWVDSLIKKIDETKYVRKFTPRKDESKWSLVNKTRMQALIADGKMTEHGLKKVEAAKRSGSWDNPGKKPDLDFSTPPEFEQALKENPQAEAFFNGLTKTYQMQYLGWIITAKRQETKEKRIKESIQLLEAGKKLGLR